LDNLVSKKKKMKLPEISSYPFVPRDLCFTMKSDVMVGDIVDAIQKVDKELIHDVSVFDVYELSDDTKSVALDFYYQSKDKTLSEEEIVGLTDRIIKVMQNKFQAELRGV